jgi:hypothetical protein
MRRYFDHPHLVVLGLVLIALIGVVAGCETPYQRERVLRSVRVETGWSDGFAERGNKHLDEESTYFAVSFAPFAGVGSPDQVIVVPATHAGATSEDPTAEPCPK